MLSFKNNSLTSNNSVKPGKNSEFNEIENVTKMLL